MKSLEYILSELGNISQPVNPVLYLRGTLLPEKTWSSLVKQSIQEETQLMGYFAVLAWYRKMQNSSTKWN